MSEPMASGPAGEAPAPDPSVAATFCATLVDEWVRAGVTDVVVAPGSRSTPITMAVANGGGLTVHVHHDERSAGFMALGLALSSGRPAVVVTTSGTAAVELHPAVVEAHQAAVPMIVVTADRPPELHSVGAPQTVEQVGLFGTSVRWACAPGVPDAAAAGSWRSIGARSVAEATDSVAGPGPVHLDLAFRDPLTGRAGPLPPGRPDGRSWHTTGGGRLALSRQGVARLTELLDADRGVIVAGAGAGDPALVLELAGATGWPVLADPPSGCRRLDERVVGAFDALLRHDGFAARQQPEVVLRLGRAPASKVLGTWLAASGARQVVVTADGRWIDPDRTAAHVLHADPTAVCTALARTVTRPHNRAWLESWASAEAAAQAALDDVLGAHPEPTEPGIARTLLATAPEDATVVVSSSMPVRDLEWYGTPRADVRVLANRGANGIDGVTSTAVGAALAALSAAPGAVAHPTILLTGDVAFLHDANGLLGAAGRGIDLTVVVVDNDGGGIFSFLPQAADIDPDQFEQLFGTPHGVDIPMLAAAHGLITLEPAAAADVGPSIAAAVHSRGVRLVRVRTDRAANVALHAELHAAVAAALDTLA